MNDEERYLKTKTFLCKVFNAKISKKQCKYQCAKSVDELRYRDGVEICEDEDLQRCLDCMLCKRFSQPSQEDIDMLTNTVKRYNDTKDGETDRKIMSYKESSNFLRKLND